MSANKDKPHLIIMPEDGANRQIANGFEKSGDFGNRMQILQPSGGWSSVVSDFNKNESSRMIKYPERRVLLLIDFDNKENRFTNRFAEVQSMIPSNLIHRVFILGSFYEPEDLKRATKLSFEKIGTALATECLHKTTTLWNHPHLQHNQPELQRMIRDVRPFLFP
jgi:hypothetical protein